MADDQPERVSVPTLIMTGGPLDGTAYPLDVEKGTLIGSSLDADVQILLGNVETFHAQIGYVSGSLMISDAGSATGTFVNGEKLEGTQPLADGDRICLGPPGAKGSAKLLVRLPADLRASTHEVDIRPTSPAGEPTPRSDEPSLFLNSDAEMASPTFTLAEEDGLTGDEAIAAEGSEPDEVPLLPVEADDDALFVSPIPAPSAEDSEGSSTPESQTPKPDAPPSLDSTSDADALPSLADSLAVPSMPPHAAASGPPRPAGPAAASPPARMSERADAPPPPPPAPPPAPPRPEGARLTAPPPPPPRRPEYQMDLPSIPLARSSEPAPRAEPFPALRPSPRPAATKRGRPAGPRRGGMRLPSLGAVLPVAGGVLALALVAFLVWRFVLHTEPPALTAVTPQQVEAGQKVTLSGSGFAKDPSANTVLVANLPAKITSASRTEIQILAPAGAAEHLPVVIETKGGRSNALELTILPSANVTALEPDVAMPGQTVFIRGEGFTKQRISVRVGGVPCPSVEDAVGGVRAVVPPLPLPEGSKTDVTVQAGNSPGRSFPLILGRLPLLIEAQPSRGRIGETVVLSGRGFGHEPNSNVVMFGKQPALVLSATSSSLTVVAPAPPAEEVQPDFSIAVSTGGRTSTSAVSFSYVRGGGATFSLRFFAAPVAEYPKEDLAFVSTELGPVLVLGRGAGGVSGGQRAVSTAGTLNRLVEAAATSPVEFEARDKPEPSVAVAGQPGALVVATAADAAAYAKPWGAQRGAERTVAPAAIARHWTALLQDYFGLFIQGRRPLQMLTISPHGKVFGEIWGEARRREPTGTAVPSSIVSAPSVATGLRLAALIVSSGGGQATAAVEGRWEGTIEDEDQGFRRFRVDLRNLGGRLSGTLITWRGETELTSPLRDVTYQQGTLRFTAMLQGAPNRFEGKLSGTKISGTIARPGKPPGRFSLEFAQ